MWGLTFVPSGSLVTSGILHSRNVQSAFCTYEVCNVVCCSVWRKAVLQVRSRADVLGGIQGQPK